MDIIDETATQEEVQSLQENSEAHSEQAVPENNEQSTRENSSSKAAFNFKNLREAKERAERERDEYLRRLQELEQKSQPSSEDEDISIAPDELAEGKHLTKVARKIKNLEQKLNQYERQTSESMVETRLKTEYPDFYDVVTKDNIEALRIAYPELAATLHATPDLYAKSKSAYTLIKKFNIQPSEDYSQEREIVQRNASKPKPLASVAPQQGESPLTRANAFANGLTDDLKQQLYKEMMEFRKH